MAKKFLTNLDLNKNQLLNAIIQNLAVEPAEGKEGQIIYDSASKKLKIHNGESWQEVGSTLTAQDVVNLINQGTLKIDKDKVQGLTEMIDEAQMSGIDIVEAINGAENTSKIDLEKLAEGLAKTSDLTPLQTKLQAESDKSELTEAIESAKESVKTELEPRIQQLESNGEQQIPQSKVEGLTEALEGVDTKDAENLKTAKEYTDSSIANLVGLASEEANTLKELEDLIKANKDEITEFANIYKKFTQEIGDGETTTHTITHNLHTTDVIVDLYIATTGEKVIADVFVTDSDTVTVKTAQPILASEKIKVVILGHNGANQ